MFFKQNVSIANGKLQNCVIKGVWDYTGKKLL